MWALLALALLVFLMERAKGQSIIPSVGSSDAVQRVAQGIARAEGYYAGDTIPFRRNNPGDIKAGGTIATYGSADEGWAALYDKIQFDLVSGNSSVYSPDMSWREFGWMWVCGTPPDSPCPNNNPDAWVMTVCNEIGAAPEARVGDYFGV